MEEVATPVEGEAEAEAAVASETPTEAVPTDGEVVPTSAEEPAAETVEIVDDEMATLEDIPVVAADGGQIEEPWNDYFEGDEVNYDGFVPVYNPETPDVMIDS